MSRRKAHFKQPYKPYKSFDNIDGLKSAVQNGEYEKVKEILEVEKRDQFKLSSFLITAVENNQSNIVELLITKGASVDKGLNEEKLLTFDDVSNQYQGIVPQLLNPRQFNVPLPSFTSPPLILTSEPITPSGYIIIPNIPGTSLNIPSTALMIAAQQRNFKIIDILLKSKKCDLNHRANDGSNAIIHAIVHAARNGHWDIVKYLIENDKNIDLNNFDLLNAAVMQDAIDVVELLLKEGVEISKIEKKFDKSFLINIIYKGQVIMMELLIKHGANVNVSDNQGNVLYHAINSYYSKIAKLLIEKGADVNTSSPVLISAFNSGQKDIVKYLLQKGADINVKNNINQTFEFIVTQKNDSEIIQWLELTKNIDSIFSENNDESLFGNIRESQEFCLNRFINLMKIKFSEMNAIEILDFVETRKGISKDFKSKLEEFYFKEIDSFNCDVEYLIPQFDEDIHAMVFHEAINPAEGFLIAEYDETLKQFKSKIEFYRQYNKEIEQEFEIAFNYQYKYPNTVIKFKKIIYKTNLKILEARVKDFVKLDDFKSELMKIKQNKLLPKSLLEMINEEEKKYINKVDSDEEVKIGTIVNGDQEKSDLYDDALPSFEAVPPLGTVIDDNIEQV